MIHRGEIYLIDLASSSCKALSCNIYNSGDKTICTSLSIDTLLSIILLFGFDVLVFFVNYILKGVELI